jgi:hypothetical protein
MDELTIDQTWIRSELSVTHRAGSRRISAPRLARRGSASGLIVAPVEKRAKLAKEHLLRSAAFVDRQRQCQPGQADTLALTLS